MFAHNISGIEPRDRISVPCAPQSYLAISGINFHATMGKFGGIGEVYLRGVRVFYGISSNMRLAMWGGEVGGYFSQIFG